MSPSSPIPPGVDLIGGGPGAHGLVTLRAQEIIHVADHILYDHLVNPDLLTWVKPTAQILYAGKEASRHTFTQDQINHLLTSLYNGHNIVARLKGGDPYIFGRGAEEAQTLAAAGIPFEVVPGISSAIAAPAYAGIPLTHRHHASAFTVLTGHEDPTKVATAIDWKSIATAHGTKVILMSVERLEPITHTLLQHGAAPTTPVALVRWGTTPKQTTLTGTLANIAAIARQHNFQPPAVCIIGTVVELRPILNWFERRPLFGQRIVVTRTRTQASQLSSQLRALGAHVLEISTIRTEPLPLSQEQIQRLAHPSQHYDCIAFTSPNAVTYFLNTFLSHYHDIRQLGSIPIAVLGPGTQQALATYHLAPALMPSTYTTEALAHALIAQFPPGTRILLPRSNLATDTLPQLTTQANLHVDSWTIYHTLKETHIPQPILDDFQLHGAHWITFTSSSTVRHWFELHLSPPPHAIPRIASIGPITTATLREYGATPHLEATPHTIPGLIQALLANSQKSSTVNSI